MADTFSLNITGIEDVITQLGTLRRLAEDERTNLEEMSAQLAREGLEGTVHEEYRQEHLRLSKAAILTAAIINMTTAGIKQSVQTSVQTDKNIAGQYTMGNA